MFENKVVVVTGSTQGIGKRVAELLAMRGALVVINSRTKAKVDLVVEEFRSKNLNVIGMAGDVSDYNFCKLLKERVLACFGRVDYLINNAGLASKGTLIDTNPIVLERMYKVNVLGSLYPTTVFLNEIIKAKGGVLFISSVAGIVGLPSYPSYCGTKRSLVAVAECLKNEVVDYGVFVGINYPGFTENDAQKTILTPSGETKLLPARNDMTICSLDKTANCIIRQIERRKFRSFSSNQGRFVQFIYRLSPALALYVLKVNRKKIMTMD